MNHNYKFESHLGDTPDFIPQNDFRIYIIDKIGSQDYCIIEQEITNELNNNCCKIYLEKYKLADGEQSKKRILDVFWKEYGDDLFLFLVELKKYILDRIRQARQGLLNQ